MLRQRLLSVLVITPPVFAAVWWGGWWFFALLAIAALLVAWELYRLLVPSGKAHRLLYSGLAFFLLALLLLPRIAFWPGLAVVVTLPLLWPWLKKYPPTGSAAYYLRLLLTQDGIIFLGWTLGYFLLLRDTEFGRGWVFLALATTVATDSVAFLWGRTWGKHHLAPAISPRKTWEGAIAGFLAALGTSLLFDFIFHLPLSFAQALLLGGLISLAAQAGDLAESWLKRKTGVKDSSNLIPGHGGVLDRLDSHILTGIVVYYYVLSYNAGWLSWLP